MQTVIEHDNTLGTFASDHLVAAAPFLQRINRGDDPFRHNCACRQKLQSSDPRGRLRLREANIVDLVMQGSGRPRLSHAIAGTRPSTFIALVAYQFKRLVGCRNRTRALKALCPHRHRSSFHHDILDVLGLLINTARSAPALFAISKRSASWLSPATITVAPDLCHLHNYLADCANTEYHADIAGCTLPSIAACTPPHASGSVSGTQQRYVIRQDERFLC